MHAGPVTRPWRRFLRFSVRGVLVLVLVVAAGLGWIVRSARIQREAVAAIERAGGRVIYDFESNNVTPTPVGRLASPVSKGASPTGKHTARDGSRVCSESTILVMSRMCGSTRHRQ